MTEPILEVKNLCFSYDEGQEILKNINTVIYPGEKIAVIGNNGAGKSTFFLNMNGVRIPSSGDIMCKGMKITKKNRNELILTVGIEFQEADMQLIAPTVRDEISFGPLNMKLDMEEVVRRTDNAIHQMNLEKYEKQPPHYLSGGEKKRVTIGGVLSMDTPVLIFDEPTASLDPANTKLFEETALKLSESGKTILISTHDIDFAYRFADRVLVFSEGEIIADGKIDDVLKREDIIKKANLRKPVVLEMYEFLVANKKIDRTNHIPKSIEELKELL